jgi:hypothetical protein
MLKHQIDFKAAVIAVLSEVNKNMFVMNKKVRHSNQESEGVTKVLIRNCRTRKDIRKMSQEGFNGSQGGERGK